jgi:hypothetical protein
MAGMTGTHHHTQLFSIKMISHDLFKFCSSWSGTGISPISASQVARIPGVNLQHPADFFFNKEESLDIFFKG